MEESTSYSGAAIFWLYIVAALALSSITIHTILELRQQHKSKGGTQDEQHVVLFSTLAIISFVVLSGNMLAVLVQSFAAWSTSHSHETNQGVFHPIWRWSVTSRLFRDFGDTIVATQPRYLWTQNELFTTYSVCLYLGIEGKRHEIPRLWSFFGLAQILPISFAQNLFCLALLHQPIPKQHVMTDRIADFGAMSAYAYLLYIAPQTAGSRVLMYVILGARAILLHPYFTVQKSMHSGISVTAVGLQKILQGITAAVMSLSLYQTFGRYPVSSVMMAVFEHPAVSALGCDSVIAAVSLGLWKLVWQEGEIAGSQGSALNEGKAAAAE
ncbi:hypothetical protein Tdes44962_MAKER03009 [Teratosphaeria destructans]|uniref:Uncharacterized protein n=1 Tax=Teratosphaeria destructans TaxID=418781 RepID=A0A9W7W2B6_9PEZI|nr:hypothetical protein Tdes44962_MAKER03009 [Teratosphaeria destructans]